MGTKEVHFYLNPDLPMEQKIEDLLSKMTLEEKTSQLKTRETHIWRIFSRLSEGLSADGKFQGWF